MRSEAWGASRSGGTDAAKAEAFWHQRGNERRTIQPSTALPVRRAQVHIKAVTGAGYANPVLDVPLRDSGKRPG